MFPEMEAISNKFKLRADAGEVYNDDLELVFAELPKFNKTENELETELDRWYYFLKHADDLKAIPGSLKAEAPIAHAFELANKAALTPEELDDQERREIYIQDQRGAIQLAEDRGLEKGRLEGEEIGKEIGKVEERSKLVKQAKKSGMLISEIAVLFDMTEEEVERILNN